MKVQTEMAERAIELLALPEDGKRKLILDLGCGSGLSGKVIAEYGHYWIGMDISHSMLGTFSDLESKTYPIRRGKKAIRRFAEGRVYKGSKKHANGMGRLSR